MAASYWPFLNEATPLFKRSRALSLLQPVTPNTSSSSTATAKIRFALALEPRCAGVTCFIEAYVIEASIPARILIRPARGIPSRLSVFFQFRREQSDGIDARGFHDI